MKSLEPVKSRQAPAADAQAAGDFSAGEVLIAAARHGDWIRLAGTAELWGVEYSREAQAMVAQVPHGLEAAPPVEASVWVPIAARSNRALRATA